MAVPVLIYAPGLGDYQANTADGVADVIAAVLDRRRAGRYASTTDTTVTAPRGLRVGKTVTDERGTPLLHVLELDYKVRFDTPPSAAGPPPSPGVVMSSLMALRGTGMFIRALRRGAKTPMAKLQLAMAFAALCALLFAAALTLVAALVAAGVPVPTRIEDFFDGDAATATFTVLGVTVVLAWTKSRKALLAIAATMQRTIAYVDNDDRYGDTVAMTIDDAVDGLRDSGWHGPIHLLGYSFGSLVLFDAMFPKEQSFRSSDAVGHVASITTIGCPIDAVRLFRPDVRLDDRVPGAPAAPWRNVFIATDVFGSNLRDDDDTTAGEATALAIPGVQVESIRYLDHKLDWEALLKVKGFRSHAGYWGTPGEASCFDVLVDLWCPAVAAPAAALPNQPV
jgi:hypothetical protein